ncbi:helix-turn-helix domain-containing protein [Amycolatopsis sp. PS_44_ISF1]|uniref:helix-turn-helix domain-containing protein n=1 Tax=Amycolatopsis sp. PS_44_ISF1 TaxID=2974917 RepID=UPI0028E0617A|nr:helix-turn-helix domain-containing protein [Amycolatopsis sp. PS_44_ISF1]MDT8910163.1 helix-turn-helix domain-containing protein [Amycolatopsis sp. PS_44_ISF1]
MSAGCGARTIGYAFRDRLGTSPTAYGRDLRLDRIRAEIMSTKDSTGEVARRWGRPPRSVLGEVPRGSGG